MMIDRNHYKLRITSFVIRAIEIISFRRIRIGCFYMLRYSGIPKLRNTIGRATVRICTINDLVEMGSLQGKHKIMSARYESGDRCIIATCDGKIVGYEWFSVRRQNIEDRYLYKITIPDDSIYCYDAYIKPEYRISGIWIRFKNCIRDLLIASGRTNIITMVDYNNVMSLNTHLRFGFRAYKRVVAMRFFGAVFCLEKALGTEVPGPLLAKSP